MKNLFYRFGIVMTISCSSCVASARLESAVVTELNGLPCFSVPKTSETRNGIPLSVLAVSRRPEAHENLPEIVWSFSVEPAAKTILTRPEICFRYGVTPDGAERTESKALKPHHIYVVDIQAKHAGTILKGFQAEFCIRVDNKGKSHVQEVPWNDKSSSWNYEICTKR